jgi:hypothetical protein
MSSIKEWTFGAHQARWEYSDLLRITCQGPTRVEDVDSILSICEEVAADGPIFVISDVTKSTIDKASRERFTQNLRAEWFHGLVYVGADALQRAIIKAIVIALYFTGKWRVDVEFAQTEEEALQIIARMRRARGVAPRLAPAVASASEPRSAQA